jgi:glycosyltransferase involved in cell wall biosynthesis
MRVLFVPSWYPRPGRDVEGTFVREHARAAARYADVQVLHVHQSDGSYEHRTEGPPQEIAVGYQAGRGLHARAAYAGAVRRASAMLPKGWRPDVVHLHVAYPAGAAALWASARWRAPLVYTEHAGPLDALLSSRTARAVGRAVAARAVLGLPVSAALGEDMQRLHVAPRQLLVVPNAVDPATFVSRNRRTSSKRLRLLTVAMLVPGKGLEYAIDMVDVLKTRGYDLSLDIVGDGHLREELIARARRHGVGENVRFLGELSKVQVAERMWTADALVLPSLRETFGVVAAEALVAGLPVVATRCGGPETVVGPLDGVLVRRGDAEALADGVVEVRQTRYEGLARRALDRFGSDAVGRQLAAVYAAAVLPSPRVG